MKVGRTMRSPLGLIITRCPALLYRPQNLPARAMTSCATGSSWLRHVLGTAEQGGLQWDNLPSLPTKWGQADHRLGEKMQLVCMLTTVRVTCPKVLASHVSTVGIIVG